jgi:hypothetical protein
LNRATISSSESVGSASGSTSSSRVSYESLSWRPVSARTDELAARLVLGLASVERVLGAERDDELVAAQLARARLGDRRAEHEVLGLDLVDHRGPHAAHGAQVELAGGRQVVDRVLDLGRGLLDLGGRGDRRGSG